MPLANALELAHRNVRIERTVSVGFKRVTPSARRVAGCESTSLRSFAANQNYVPNSGTFADSQIRRFSRRQGSCPRYGRERCESCLRAAQVIRAVDRMHLKATGLPAAGNQMEITEDQKSSGKPAQVFDVKPGPSGYEGFLPEWLQPKARQGAKFADSMAKAHFPKRCGSGQNPPPPEFRARSRFPPARR